MHLHNSDKISTSCYSIPCSRGLLFEADLTEYPGAHVESSQKSHMFSLRAGIRLPGKGKRFG